MNRLGVALVMVALLATRAAAQDFDSGLTAYNRANYALALRALTPLAEAGDARAQKILGLMHFAGEGVPVDGVAAARWFRRAAEQGDAVAQTTLGALYEYGLGVARDPAASADWYRRAAAQGGADMQLSQALWSRLEAARGDAGAQHRLSRMYARGEGAPQDFVLAHMWAGLAAAQGDARAAEWRDFVAGFMTQDQLTQSTLLARQRHPAGGS
jgi:TPR repeat protein